MIRKSALTGFWGRRWTLCVAALTLLTSGSIRLAGSEGSWPGPSMAGSAAAVAAVNVRVSSWLDDGEEQLNTGAMYLDSTDIELVDDADYQGLQMVGLRFQGVAVPKAATILRAYVEFTTDETDSVATSLQFRGQASDNAPAFANVYFDITSRPKTSAVVNWNDVPPWPTTGVTHQTPDLSPIVQEIVNRSGWSAGQALALLVTGSGERTAVAYDGDPAAAALLHIEYSTGSELAITGISPNYGPNTGIIHISDLGGANFQPGATVKLARSGQPDIQATNVVVVSTNRISCDLDLTGAVPGAWNVIVTNPDSRVATLPGGFTVQGSGGQRSVYLPLAVRRWPQICSLYVVNNTGCGICYEVLGSGVGRKCYPAMGASNYYGAFPAGTYGWEFSACCGKANGVEYYLPGKWEHRFWCTAEMELR